LIYSDDFHEAKKMKESEEIIQAPLNYRNKRDWVQFHNPKDLVPAINIEAGELLEFFLWKNAGQETL
jgi:hypothetical protein